MNHKVMYYQGEQIDLKTKVAVGRLEVGDGRLFIQGKQELTVAFDSLQSVELFRMHGIGRMLKVQHSDGTLFVAVIRCCLFGLFAISNFSGTGRLRDAIQLAINQNS